MQLPASGAPAVTVFDLTGRDRAVLHGSPRMLPVVEQPAGDADVLALQPFELIERPEAHPGRDLDHDALPLGRIRLRSDVAMVVEEATVLTRSSASLRQPLQDSGCSSWGFDGTSIQ